MSSELLTTSLSILFQGLLMTLALSAASIVGGTLIDSGSKDTLIESVELVGPLPAKDARFRRQYDIYVTSLEQKGVRATLENLDSLVD